MNPLEPVSAAALASAWGSGRRPPTTSATRRRAPRTAGWPELLDTLEDRTRRLAAIVEDGSGELPSEEIPDPDGPLPAELELPLRALLAETVRLQDRAERRKAVVQRQLRYSRS